MIKFRIITILVSLILYSQTVSASCTITDQVYEQSVKKKILSGVPFEIVGLLISNDSNTEKMAISFTYDLWDEVITIRDNVTKKTAKDHGKAKAFFCNKVSSFALSKGRKGKFQYQILLNPKWEGRINRLEGSAIKQSKNSLEILRVDWKYVRDSMPKDQILYSAEVTL